MDGHIAAPAAPPADRPQEVRFHGASAVDELCTSLLNLKRSAEAQGRLDFAAEVESAGAGDAVVSTARIWPGSAHHVGAINFTVTPAWTTPRSAVP